MCSEPHGLSGWPRKAARWLALIAAAVLALGAIARALGLPDSGV